MSDRIGYDTITVMTTNRLNKRRMNNKAFAFAVIALILAFLLCGCSVHETKEGVVPSPKAVATEASQTVSPSPTEAASSTELPEGLFDCTEKEARAAAEALLRGEAPLPVWTHSGSAEYRLVEEEDGSHIAAFESHIAAEPAFVLPADMTELVRQSLASLVPEAWQQWPDAFSELNFPMTGAFGEDWFLIANPVDSGYQLHTIFRMGSDGEWREFGSASIAAGGRSNVTDAAVISENEGFVCIHSSYYDDGRYERLYVTHDGGKSWEDAMLSLPEEYSDWLITELYAPTFDGDHGAVLVTAGDYYAERGPDEPGTHLFGWFETNDRGASWQFRVIAKAVY